MMVVDLFRRHTPGALTASGVCGRDGCAIASPWRCLWSVVLVFILMSGLLPEASSQTHFAYRSHTGNNGTIVIPLSSRPGVGDSALAHGDEIGIFTPGGICAGSGTWTGTNLAITIWGDDDLTPEVDGMIAGERISFRVWSRSRDVVYRTVSATFAMGTGRYAVNGIYSLSSLRASIVNVDDPAPIPVVAQLFQNYPNPWNPSTVIAFSISQESEISLDLFTPLGKELSTIARGVYRPGRHELRLMARDLSSGWYVYRLRARALHGNGTSVIASRTMLLLK